MYTVRLVPCSHNESIFFFSHPPSLFLSIWFASNGVWVDTRRASHRCDCSSSSALMKERTSDPEVGLASFLDTRSNSILLRLWISKSLFRNAKDKVFDDRNQGVSSVGRVVQWIVFSSENYELLNIFQVKCDDLLLFEESSVIRIMMTRGRVNDGSLLWQVQKSVPPVTTR